MKALYQFFWDCDRMGELDGLFIADQDAVNNAIGKQVYFGEVLGKHSEIYGTLYATDLTEVSTNPEVISVLETALGTGTISGHNPLEHLEDGN